MADSITCAEVCRHWLAGLHEQCKIREIILGKALDPMAGEGRHSMASAAF